MSNTTFFVALHYLRLLVDANLRLLSRDPASRARASNDLAIRWAQAREHLPATTRDALDGAVSREVRRSTVTCSCERTYTIAQFDALPLPANGCGRWDFGDDETARICRQCECGTMWSRAELAHETLVHDAALETALDDPHHSDVDAMPTHCDVDYDDEDWRDEARRHYHADLGISAGGLR